MTPAGPDALGVAVSELAVAQGSAVTLTATLNDTRFSNVNGAEPVQDVAAGEYYVDVPAWVTSTLPVAIPMTATDGAFDESVEGVEAIVDTASLSPGRHILYVRGQDAADNWGTYSASFLFIVDPAVSPVIEGTVIAADTSQPLEATVTANGLFTTQTDPPTGYYSMQVISGTYDIVVDPVSPDYGPATAEGVVAEDYQTVEQNFVLYPYCTSFEDDVEAGNQGWTAEAPWAIVTEMSHSPTHSWTDSPGGSYQNNRNVSLTSAAFDLSEYSGIQLNFWQICDTETGYDYCTVEVSNDGGATWTALASYDGPHTQWQEITLDAPQLDGAAEAQVRFHFTSDESVIDDGWHLDDVRIIGSGPGCGGLIPPTAGFSSTSPDYLGETTAFTNESFGSTLVYEWDFGDGSPISTEMNPTHDYAAVGTYTVTLTATNDLGSDTATGTVEILAAEPPAAGFTSTSPDFLGDPTQFTNTSTGTNLTFEWDFGDGSPTSAEENPSHTYAAAGVYTATLTVTNSLGSSTVEGTVLILVPGESWQVFLPLLRREP
jgi:PKD repeat protein